MNNHIKMARILIQIGLAFVFGYASVEIFMNPENFLKYLPSLIRESLYVNNFLILFSVAEAVLVAWLLSGKFLKVAAAVSFVLIFSITALNMEYFSVLFRNVSIAFSSIALMLLVTSK